MKSVITVVFLLLSAVAYGDSDAQKMQLVDEYMRLAGLERTVDLYAESYTSQVMSAYPDAPTDFWAGDKYESILNQYKKDLWSSWANIYFRHLSVEELGELIDFLKTPLGMKFLEMQKALEPDFAEASVDVTRQMDIRLARLLSGARGR